jgi:hypothetical protein
MTGELATALVAFQSKMPTVAKRKTANVGQYSYTYADLADITEQAMPILGECGLAFSSCPRQTEHGYELVGRLLHTSGESEEGALPISGKTPQDWGSSITYMRRYLFGCMTGLVTDDDDDGRMATKTAKKAAPSKGKSDPRHDAWEKVRAAYLTKHKTFDQEDAVKAFEAWAAVPIAEADAELLSQFADDLRRTDG